MNDIWIAEAGAIDINQAQELLYETGRIKNFLKSSISLFISANKGMGKTLLMTAKRKAIQDKQEGSAIYIPKDRPFLDMSLSFPVLGKEDSQLLKNHTSAKRLWSIALQISTLSYIGIRRDIFEGYSLDPLLTEWIDRPIPITPTAAFSSLISESHGSRLTRLLKKYEPQLRLGFLSVQRQTYIFIDKIDQACEGFDRDTWTAIQTGLIEAAYDLSTSNPHIKIYVSIRQEAWARFNSSSKDNIRSHLTSIEYDETELRLIINSLSNFYEQKETPEACLGISTIQNDNSYTKEEIFKYMLRHSTGKPRDLVSFMNQLRVVTPAYGDEKKTKTGINTISETSIVNNAFNESKHLLNCLQNPTAYERFLALIPHGILSKNKLQQIFLYYNGLDSTTDPRTAANVEHPFFELYSIGLLGFLEPEPGAIKKIQKFKLPSDPEAREQENQLPHSEFYFLHPCLHQKMTRISDGKYNVFKGIIIGHGYDWGTRELSLYGLQQHIFSQYPQEITDSFSIILDAILTKRAYEAELNSFKAEYVFAGGDYYQFDIRLRKFLKEIHQS